MGGPLRAAIIAVVLVAGVSNPCAAFMLAPFSGGACCRNLGTLGGGCRAGSFANTAAASRGALISRRAVGEDGDSDSAGGEEGEAAAAPAAPEASEQPCGPCKFAPKCSGEYLEKGCNGGGKVIGGLGAIPGFRWWPIKAYRPCPAFLESGYQYSRQGQSLQEIVFRTKGEGDDLLIDQRLAALERVEEKEKARRNDKDDN